MWDLEHLSHIRSHSNRDMGDLLGFFFNYAMKYISITSQPDVRGKEQLGDYMHRRDGTQLPEMFLTMQSEIRILPSFLEVVKIKSNSSTLC